MKNLFLVAVLGVGVVLGGCVSPQYNYQATPKNISKPPLNTVTTAYVGDKLLEQGVYTDREALFVPKAFKRGGYTLSEGYYLKTGESKKGQFFSPINRIPNGGTVQKGAIHDPFQAVMIDPEGKVCIVTVLNAKACDKELRDVKLTTVGVATDNSFQQALIYSGKVGNKINIGYREFSSNMARPAFNNDVEYDLSESSEIGYKGALLKVINANNQSIEYEVIRNFNKVD